jgi:nitroimidazol reductase NimA-like FMN-containing flavoprotein (pyridoxamine 5'-phosphate oxidase superfamily)
MSHIDELTGFEVLSAGDCLALLAGTYIGRVGFVVNGLPHVLPVNYGVDRDASVVFRTTSASSLTAVDGAGVTFEVDGFDARARVGWSVCVHGRGREISGADDPAAQRLRELGVVTWAPGRRDRWFAITPDAITGRRLPLQPVPDDFGWSPGVVG